MDLDSVRSRGKSTSKAAWFTNPVRSILWRLLVPYFEGMAAAAAGRERRLAKIAARGAKAEAKMRHLHAEIQHLHAEMQRYHAEILAIVEEGRMEARQRLAGALKDFTAMTHRLAGLEECMSTTSLVSAPERADLRSTPCPQNPEHQAKGPE